MPVLFQRRHYKAIASVLNTLPHDVSTEVAIRAFAKMFSEDNEEFQEDKFLAACDMK